MTDEGGNVGGVTRPHLRVAAEEFATVNGAGGEGLNLGYLLDQVSRAFSVGIASTPTYIVNGQIMGFGPEGKFTEKAIKDALGVK